MYFLRSSTVKIFWEGQKILEKSWVFQKKLCLLRIFELYCHVEFLFKLFDKSINHFIKEFDRFFYIAVKFRYSVKASRFWKKKSFLTLLGGLLRISELYSYAEFLLKLFHKIVNERDFLKIINLYRQWVWIFLKSCWSEVQFKYCF